MKKIIALVSVVLLGIFASSATYTVTETEQVVITRFGKPQRVVLDAGLHMKLPVVDAVVTLEKRLLPWDGEPENMPTLDKKRIFVDTFALWRITDLRRFYESVRSIQGGHKKLDDLIDPAVRDVVTQHNLIEAIRSTDTPLQFADKEFEHEQAARQTPILVGRASLEKKILEAIRAKGLSEFGMEVVYVGFKRIDYISSVRDKVYDRMRAERERIAKLLLSEAKEQANIIRGDAQFELEEITGTQNREVAKITGQADADAIRIWQEAIGEAPDFYGFLRTMEALQAMPPGSRMVLSTNNEFLKPLVGKPAD
jgi:membrane protease subunit HflC